MHTTLRSPPSPFLLLRGPLNLPDKISTVGAEGELAEERCHEFVPADNVDLPPHCSSVTFEDLASDLELRPGS